MIKKITFFSILFLTTSLLYAQNTEALKASALRDAGKMSKAVMAYDYENTLKYTHPNIYNAVGGKEVMIKVLESTFREFKREGLKFEKSEPLSVSDVIKEQGEYRCIVESELQMIIKGFRIKSKTFMVGFYNEKEKQWVFARAEKMKEEKLRKRLFPDFKTSMEIPTNEILSSEKVKE